LSQVFNGTSDVAYNTSLPVTARPFTLACWVKPTNLTVHQNQCPLGIGYDDGTGSSSLSAPFVYWNGSAYKWAIYLSGGGFTAASTGPTSGTWYHVCLTVSSTGGATLYVNGSSVATAAGAKTPTAGVSRGASIHNSGVTTFASPFGGELGEVAVWNVALSSTQVATVAGGTGPGGDKAVTVQLDKLQKYQGLCDSADTGGSFHISWPVDTTSGTTFTPGACGGDPQGCGRNPLPSLLYLSAQDHVYSGACARKNERFGWSRGQQYWYTSMLTNTCIYDYVVTVSGSSFTLKIYNTGGTLLNTYAAAAASCNPLTVSFLANGSEYNGCTCDEIPHIQVTENQV
jgi:Concanavalin A-like lectin/glucanases superfamily